MKFSEYIKYNTTSITNNTRYTKIDERQLMLEHASDLDSVIYKYSLYANNISNHIVNESRYDETFTLSEQAAANGLLRFVCEEYIESLNNELTLYEHIYNDTINEGLGDYFKKAKSVIVKAAKKGKSWVSNQIESLKIKIKEIKEFLVQLANDAIKSVKEMTEKLMSLLEKFDCTIKGLFEKIKIFDIDKLEKSWTDESQKVADQIKTNPKSIEKFKIYESLSNDLKNNDLITEDEEKEGEAVNQTGKDKGGWKHALWQAFKQLAIWAVVCVAIPGVVIAAFPGTFIALLVPLVCKLAWNGYKIVKLWKQFKKVKEEWSTYGKLQKWITVISMAFSIVAIIFNFKSLFDNLGPVLEGLQKSGFDILSKANLGIQPDALQRGFAALINMLKEGKFSMDDFKASYDAISESFNQHITEKITKTVTAVVKKGQDGTEFIKNNFEDKQFKSPQEFWNKVKPSFMNPKEVTDDGMYDVVADGYLKGGTGGNAWSDKAIAIAKKLGEEKSLTPVRGFNDKLHEIFSGQGSVTGFRMSGKLLKELSDAGCLGHDNIFGIVGSVANTVSQTTVIQDIVQAATSMLVTIPSVELAPENNGGFRVRLGEKGSKNYVYEVGKDDVRTVDKKDHTKEYEDIKKTIVDNNVEYMKQLLESSKKDKDVDEKEITEKLKEFKENFEKNIDDGKCILIYGKKVDEETNESYVSLRDYLIMEGVTFDNLAEEINKISNWIKKEAGPYGFEGKDGVGQSIKLKDWDPKRIHHYVDAFKKISSGDAAANKELKMLNKGRDEKEKKYPITPIDLISRFYYNVVWDEKLSKKSVTYEDIYNLFFAINDLAGALKDKKKNAENSDALNKNDVDNYCKAEYNKIIDILEKIDSCFERTAIIKDLKLRKKFKITDKDKEDFIKKTNEKKPEETTEKDIENKIKQSNISDEEKEILLVKPTSDDADKKEETTADGSDKKEETTSDDSDKKEETKSDDADKKEETTSDDEEDDGKVKPIMLLVYGYGKDLAKADKSGPRKDPYSMKGLFKTCEFMTIEGGTSKENLAKLFGEILHQQVSELYNVVSYKPCNDKNELDDNLENDKERPELANLTNDEAASLLKDKKKGAELIKVGANKVSAAETPDEKKKLEQLHKTNSDAVKDDKELQGQLKEINPDLVDDNGNLNEKEWNRTNDILSEYQLSKHKEKSHKGFFGKIWGAIKNFFFGDSSSDGNAKYHKYTEKELEKIASLVYEKIKKDKNIKESYNDNDAVMLIRPKSLSQYILENRNR